MYEIINDAAQAYKDVIPGNCWHEPYMSLDELHAEFRDGVQFWGYEDNGELIGIMGIQDKGDVDLIRHAYVSTTRQHEGIGSKLLRYLEQMTSKPILIGTWADAAWAVRFYIKDGYRVLPRDETEFLLRQYWSIPDRQVSASVVLANFKWQSTGKSA